MIIYTNKKTEKVTVMNENNKLTETLTVIASLLNGEHYEKAKAMMLESEIYYDQIKDFIRYNEGARHMSIDMDVFESISDEVFGKDGLFGSGDRMRVISSERKAILIEIVNHLKADRREEAKNLIIEGEFFDNYLENYILYSDEQKGANVDMEVLEEIMDSIPQHVKFKVFDDMQTKGYSSISWKDWITLSGKPEYENEKPFAQQDGDTARKDMDSAGFTIDSAILSNRDFREFPSEVTSINLVSRKAMERASDKVLSLYREKIVEKYAVALYARNIQMDGTRSDRPYGKENVKEPLRSNGWYFGDGNLGYPFDGMILFDSDITTAVMDELNLPYDTSNTIPYYVEMVDEVFDYIYGITKDDVQKYIDEGKVNDENIAQKIAETIQTVPTKSNPWNLPTEIVDTFVGLNYEERDRLAFLFESEYEREAEGEGIPPHIEEATENILAGKKVKTGVISEFLSKVDLWISHEKNNYIDEANSTHDEFVMHQNEAVLKKAKELSIQTIKELNGQISKLEKTIVMQTLMVYAKREYGSLKDAPNDLVSAIIETESVDYIDKELADKLIEYMRKEIFELDESLEVEADPIQSTKSVMTITALEKGIKAYEERVSGDDFFRKLTQEEREQFEFILSEATLLNEDWIVDLNERVRQRRGVPENYIEPLLEKMDAWVTNEYLDMDLYFNTPKTHNQYDREKTVNGLLSARKICREELGLSDDTDTYKDRKDKELLLRYMKSFSRNENMLEVFLSDNVVNKDLNDSGEITFLQLASPLDRNMTIELGAPYYVAWATREEQLNDIHDDFILDVHFTKDEQKLIDKVASKLFSKPEKENVNTIFSHLSEEEGDRLIYLLCADIPHNEIPESIKEAVQDIKGEKKIEGIETLKDTVDTLDTYIKIESESIPFGTSSKNLEVLEKAREMLVTKVGKSYFDKKEEVGKFISSEELARVMIFAREGNSESISRLDEIEAKFLALMPAVKNIEEATEALSNISGISIDEIDQRGLLLPIETISDYPFADRNTFIGYAIDLGGKSQIRDEACAVFSVYSGSVDDNMLKEIALDLDNSVQHPEGTEYDLLYTNAGGCTVVSNRNKIEDGDYQRVAYLHGTEGVRYFINDLPDDVRESIEDANDNEVLEAVKLKNAQRREANAYARKNAEQVAQRA